jgi:hypothetical protein
MICRRCGRKLEKGWRFCPNCGSTLEARPGSLFDEIFSRFRREFEGMDRLFDKDFEVLDLSPFLRNERPRGSGFKIRITRRGNERPKVNVETFGNVKPGAVRRAMPHGPRQVIPARPAPHDAPAPMGEQHRPPRVTEEPRTQVRRSGDNVVVEMDLHDIKSEREIDVKELESSVEVRARAGDKAYFKIITKPERLSITGRRFDNGKLFLEFS